MARCLDHYYQNIISCIVFGVKDKGSRAGHPKTLEVRSCARIAPVRHPVALKLGCCSSAALSVETMRHVVWIFHTLALLIGCGWKDSKPSCLQYAVVTSGATIHVWFSEPGTRESWAQQLDSALRSTKIERRRLDGLDSHATLLHLGCTLTQVTRYKSAQYTSCKANDSPDCPRLIKQGPLTRDAAWLFHSINLPVLQN